MPTWNENEYVQRANDIAREFVTLKKPLNDLCEKVARDEAMNPDEIRTLVRLSNVAAFQQLFKEKEGDKMVEFDVGNPESVISRIQSSAEAPPQTANIHNDKLAFEIPDQMKEIRLGRKFDERVKVAHEDVKERAPRKDTAIIAARKLANEMDIEKRVLANKWEYLTNKLAREFKKAAGYGPSFTDFAAAALAEHGEDARPELELIVKEARLKGVVLPEGEKVAFLQERLVTEDSKELDLLKQALETRHAYVKMKNGEKWLQENLSGI
jgi:hypothetical protein